MIPYSRRCLDARELPGMRKPLSVELSEWLGRRATETDHAWLRRVSSGRATGGATLQTEQKHDDQREKTGHIAFQEHPESLQLFPCISPLFRPRLVARPPRTTSSSPGASTGSTRRPSRSCRQRRRAQRARRARKTRSACLNDRKLRPPSILLLILPDSACSAHHARPARRPSQPGHPVVLVSTESLLHRRRDSKIVPGDSRHRFDGPPEVNLPQTSPSSRNLRVNARHARHSPHSRRVRACLLYQALLPRCRA